MDGIPKLYSAPTLLHLRIFPSTSFGVWNLDFSLTFLLVAPLPLLLLPWDQFVEVLLLCVIRPLLLTDVCPKLLLEYNTSLSPLLGGSLLGCLCTYEDFFLGLDGISWGT